MSYHTTSWMCTWIGLCIFAEECKTWITLIVMVFPLFQQIRWYMRCTHLKVFLHVFVYLSIFFTIFFDILLSFSLIFYLNKMLICFFFISTIDEKSKKVLYLRLTVDASTLYSVWPDVGLLSVLNLLFHSNLLFLIRIASVVHIL